MKTLVDKNRVSQWVVVGAAALLPFSLAACGDDSAGPETGADVEDITEEEAYFADDQFLGETVTVSAEVTQVLSPTSFELAGEDRGDESLLVTSAAEVQDLREGEVVQVTGEVSKFVYVDDADEYGLADAGLYEPYESEEFLAASNVDKTVG
jgi:hypothetical protein